MSTRSFVLVSSIVAGCLASLAGPAAAQEPLFQSQHFTGPGACESLAAGDLDGDGDLDVVAGGSSELRVLLNQGHRVFLPAGAISGGGTDVTLGDLDGDGALDLVVTTASPAVLARLGLGDGTFGAATSYALSYTPAEAEIGDLDLDDDLDLVVVQDDGRVKILLNDGAAAFTFALDVGPAGASNKRLEIADLDGDGLPDLAVSAALGDVRLFRGLGRGAFEPFGTIASTFVPNDLAAADFDEDGDVDLAVVDETAGHDRLLAFANDGDGSFSGPVFEVPLPFLPRFLSVADVNEDGLLDALVSQVGGGSRVHVFLGLGDLTFTPTASVATTVPGEILVSDLDADGDLDLALSEGFSGRVALAWGEGDGTFRKGPALADSGQEVVVDDMNGDGRLDVVAASYAGVAVVLNVGDGHLPDVLEQTSVDFQYGVATGDVDGDGDSDVVSANWSITLGPGASLWLNDGTGALAPPTPLPVPPRMQDVASADLDLDGDVDFVFVANSGGPSPGQGLVWVLLGMGDGSFKPAEYYGAPHAMQAVAVADFNADGLPDVVTSTLFFSQLHVLLGNGDGTLGVPISGPLGDVANDLVAADFNADGAADVAFSRALSAPVLGVKLGNGDGSFGPAAAYGETASYGNLAAGDVDHDGVVDLVVGQGSLSVFHGDGDGTFTFVESVAMAVGSTRIVVADLDGDGWSDLAGSKGGDSSSELWVLRNQHGPWNDLGHPLTGTAGLPRQTGQGSLIGGQPFAFKLRDAKPLTKAYHVVGIGTLNAPFKGGVMVPTIDFINGFPTTNSQGELTLAGHWIAFPPGLSLYFQFWLPDPAGPAGFAASNAISATMP